MAPFEETASQLSSMSSTGPDEIKIEIRFEGHWEPQANGNYKYVGGQKYWEKVPSKLDYASLMHRMSAKINGAVTLKYAPPGEEKLDPEGLVTCVDNEHVQEMLEEYWKARKEHSTPGKTFRLQMWLYKADEEDVTIEDIEGFGHGRSSLGSNQSSLSARSHQLNGRRLEYTPSATSKQALDADMQQKEAQQAVEWMAEQEVNEANWQLHLARNLYRAHECTYDSFGWPHDRSPFLRAMDHRLEHAPSAGHTPLIGHNGSLGGRETSQPGYSPRMLARGIVSPEDVAPQHRPQSPWLEAAPMEAGGVTPLHPQHSPRFFTQDPYKEQPGSGVRVDLALQRSGPRPKSRGNFFLPSLLGSEVGNAPQTTLDAAEKAHIENVVAGMVHYALQDGSTDTRPRWLAEGVGSDRAGDPGLYRTPSRLAITYDNVYRIPQTEIHVVDTIGEGTFGEVVLATNEVFGKVAVKWLKPAKMDKHKAKFWEEARMLAVLNHPNVLRFYGVVTAGPADQTVVGIMTEFMHGSSLSNYLRSGSSRIGLIQRAELAREAVNGLAYLHAMNIVHFDLKPDNLLLDRPLTPGCGAPHVKVADFGLSKQKFRKYVSGVRDLRGTLPYMAPELVSDPDHVTESADVWSLGIVFWEMLTMETPFQHLTPQGIITGLMVGQLRPEIPEDCEPEWLWLLEGCLRTNPAHRLTLRDIATQLDRIVQEAPPLQSPVSPY